MACGCSSACGCEVIGDGSSAAVVRDGDTFVVSATPLVESVVGSDCIDAGVAAGELTVAQIINATADEGIELECTATGLHARLVIDPDSTAPISVGADGLRVDCCPSDGEPAILENRLPGEVIAWPGVLVPAGALETFGQEAPQASYPFLYDALTLYSESASRSMGSPVITGLTTTRYIEAGMSVQATGFPTAATVLSVDSSTQITLDAVASTSGVGDTEVRVHVEGTPADPASDFIVPDLRDRTIVGMGDMGGTDAGLLSSANTLGLEIGQEAVTLLEANLPEHDHGTSISGSGTVPTSNTGSHNHQPATSGRSFIDAHSGSITDVSVDGGGGGTTYSIKVGNASSGANPLGQGSDQNTTTDGAHQHTVSADAIAGALSVSEDTVGSGDAVSVMQPGKKMRYIIVTG